MERLKNIKNTLISQIQGQLGHLETVDANELGEVVDMVKDIEEAIYYCTITKSMEEAEKDEKKQDTTLYYTENYYPERDMDKKYGRMYYTENTPTNTAYPYPPMHYTTSGTSTALSGNNTKDYPVYYRDYREGQSPMSRRTYLESKEMHKDKNIQINELEKYLQELTKDVTEMAKDASPEEKLIIKNKIATLVEKVK